MKNLTEEYYDYEAWQELHPETIHGQIYSNAYWGFYSSGGDEGGIVVNFESGEITTLDFYTDAAYCDPKTGRLYYVKEQAS